MLLFVSKGIICIIVKASFVLVSCRISFPNDLGQTYFLTFWFKSYHVKLLTLVTCNKRIQSGLVTSIFKGLW